MKARQLIICKTCGKKHEHAAHGMCRKCYLKWYRVNKEPTRKKTICAECGESKIHYGHGVCKSCYNKLYNAQHQRKKIICKVCGKKRGHMGHGMCTSCYMQWYYERTGLPFSKNTSSSSYLGIHVAERVLKQVFKNIKIMPTGNPGYDFICNKNMKIDVKSACISKRNNWGFNINKNTTADYFLCIAFDNRKSLTPLHLWLIQGNNINHQLTASIKKSTINKWKKYELDISKTLQCCNEMKRPARQMCCHASPNPECGRKV